MQVAILMSWDQAMPDQAPDRARVQGCLQDQVADVPGQGDQTQAAPHANSDGASEGLEQGLRDRAAVEETSQEADEALDGKRYPARTRNLVQHYKPGQQDGARLATPPKLRVGPCFARHAGAAVQGPDSPCRQRALGPWRQQQPEPWAPALTPQCRMPCARRLRCSTLDWAASLLCCPDKACTTVRSVQILYAPKHGQQSERRVWGAGQNTRQHCRVRP